MQLVSRFLIIAMAFVCLASLSACVGARYARTSVGQAFVGEVRIEQPWGEVLCGDGRVCAEAEVTRVDFEKRDGGRVEVTLHNRTGVSLIVQIALEIYKDDGAVLDRTTFQNLPIPPRQDQSWSMPGIYRSGAKVRVILRSTAS
jgi:hypothetical protein